jgi:DNA helicase-2/ATP-dependent DNA helicase PcrA
VSFGRVVNVPGRGIGARTIEEFERWARLLRVPPYVALQALAAQERGGEPGLPPRRPALAARQVKALVAFLELLDELIAVAAKNPLSTLLDAVLERTAYRRYLHAAFDGQEADERWANVQELRNVAAAYDELSPANGLMSFLESVALVSDADTMAEGDDARGRVTLITLHSAKGLEFPVVFMTAMEEGVLPHVRSFDDPAQMEEERRLCYVGMTRAKERLYLVRAFRRHTPGGSQHAPPSRFLRDIPPELAVQRSGVADEAAAVARGPQRFREAFTRREEQAEAGDARPPGLFSGGEKVRHPRFGEGIVVACVDRGDDQEVTVSFKGAAGLKKVMRSFAGLERI